MKLIHPKCIGEKCGSWEMCFNANILKHGCVYCDDEAMDMEVENE